MRKLLAIVVGIALAFPAYAAITERTAARTTCVDASGTSHTCVFAGTLAAGDFLFACGHLSGTAINASASDGTNGSWTESGVGVVSTTFGDTMRCWYFVNNASTGTPTFSWSTTGSAATDTVMGVLIGVKTSSAIVGTPAGAGNTGNVSTKTCATVTPTAANQALIGALIEEAAGNTNIVPNNGETEIAEASSHLLQAEWRLTPNTTPIGASWQINNPNADEVACINLIVDAAAGANGVVNPLDGPTRLLRTAR